MGRATRRTFLRLAAAGLSSALLPLLPSCAERVGQSRPVRRYPTPDAPLTPAHDWYVYAFQGAYEADAARYRMKVGGVARRALSLSVADLRAQFPSHLLLDTVSCVGNSPGGALLSSALFRGARLADVMEAAGVSSSATGAVVLALDGFVATQDIGDLRKRPCLLAYEMGTTEADLRPLPVENGFPVRLLTPGLYGYKQPKWIDSITFMDQDGYDLALARSVNYAGGRMQLSSGFSVPRGGQLTAGTHDLYGYAFGDGRRIAKVEVRVDDRPWEAAEIVWNDGVDDKPSHVWCLFRYRWAASSPGIHRLTPRATYEDGEVQKGGREFPYSGGSLAPIELEIGGAS